MLAEQGLTFDRADYAARFMGLSTDAYHAAIDVEARARLGRPVSESIRQSDRLRAVMVAELTQVDGAAMLSFMTLFLRGLGQGALTAAACFAALAITFAAVFFVLLCAAPLKRLQR